MLTSSDGKVRINNDYYLVPISQAQEEARVIGDTINGTAMTFDSLEFMLILPGTLEEDKMDELFDGAYYKLINSQGIEPEDAYHLENLIAGAVKKHRLHIGYN